MQASPPRGIYANLNVVTYDVGGASWSVAKWRDSVDMQIMESDGDQILVPTHNHVAFVAPFSMAQGNEPVIFLGSSSDRFFFQTAIYKTITIKDLKARLFYTLKLIIVNPSNLRSSNNNKRHERMPSTRLSYSTYCNFEFNKVFVAKYRRD